MVDPVSAFTLFDKALSVLGLIRDEKKQRSAKMDQALLALYAALVETRSYISERESGKARDKKKEIAIARLWSTASVPLREIDTKLAERCFEKGGYWMEPDVWDQKRIEAKGIAIENMFEATRQLLLR
jgi:hypothetical protein